MTFGKPCRLHFLIINTFNLWRLQKNTENTQLLLHIFVHICPSPSIEGAWTPSVYLYVCVSCIVCLFLSFLCLVSTFWLFFIPVCRRKQKKKAIDICSQTLWLLRYKSISRGFTIWSPLPAHIINELYTQTMAATLSLSQPERHEMKFVVVGPGGAGKSAITLAFVRNMYVGIFKVILSNLWVKPWINATDAML